MRKSFKILSILTVLLVAIVVSGVAVLKSIDFNQYKDVLVKEVEKITGRKLVINGNFKLDLGLDTVLAVEDVQFANAPWGSQKNMVKLKKLYVDVKLLPLIQQEIQVERLILVDLDVILETDRQGKGNWVLGDGQQPAGDSASTSSSSPIPVIQEVDIKNLNFTFHDGQKGKTTKAVIDELTLAGEDNKSPLNIALSTVQCRPN